MSKQPSGEDIFRQIAQQSQESDEVMELGPRTAAQGGLFERMRAGITPGEVLRSTFDEAVKKIVNIDNIRQMFPRVVDEETFNADVSRIQSMTDSEYAELDYQIMSARRERRAPTGRGVYVDPDRLSGFGSDVFGFAYEAYSGKWTITNQAGIHAVLVEHLQTEMDHNKSHASEKEQEYISGLIFQIGSIQTPIINLFGYVYNTPALMSKAVEDIWGWKRFIPISDLPLGSDKPCYKYLETPEYIIAQCEAFKRQNW
jgi:hypothetical protein